MTTRSTAEYRERNDDRASEDWQAIQDIVEEHPDTSDPNADFSRALERRGSHFNQYIEDPGGIEELNQQDKQAFFGAVQETVHDPQVEYDDDEEELTSAISAATFNHLYARLDAAEHDAAMQNPDATPDVRQVAEINITRATVEAYQQRFEDLLSEEADHRAELTRIYDAACDAVQNGVSHSAAREAGIDPDAFTVEAHDEFAANAIEQAAEADPDFDAHGARSVREILSNDLANHIGIYNQPTLAGYTSLERFAAHPTEPRPHWAETAQAEHPLSDAPQNVANPQHATQYLSLAATHANHHAHVRELAGAPEDWRTASYDSAVANISAEFDLDEYEELSTGFDEIDGPYRTNQPTDWTNANFRAINYASNH